MNLSRQACHGSVTHLFSGYDILVRTALLPAVTHTGERCSELVDTRCRTPNVGLWKRDKLFFCHAIRSTQPTMLPSFFHLCGPLTELLAFVIAVA